MIIRPLLISLTTLLVYLGCQTSRQHNDFKIEGGWSFIKDDSVYSEVVFAHAQFFSYDENSGEYFGYYRWKDDSLLFYNRTRRLTLAAQVTYVSPEKFSVRTKYYSAIYHRLQEPVDTTLVFQRNEDYISKYVTAYSGRRERFKLSRD